MSHEIYCMNEFSHELNNFVHENPNPKQEDILKLNMEKNIPVELIEAYYKEKERINQGYSNLMKIKLNHKYQKAPDSTMKESERKTENYDLISNMGIDIELNIFSNKHKENTSNKKSNFTRQILLSNRSCRNNFKGIRKIHL